ncbi:MAG: hypothetical protein IKQ93_06900, partial [Candidatus Methanomethylophilaceae archaeon]|nr:hypothetical protein [Candidatus Methanomethylophilaceae archaeon]
VPRCRTGLRRYEHERTRIYEQTNRYVRKTGNKSAAMYFGVDDAKDFADKSGTELLECIPFFTDARKKLWRKTHLITRISMAWADRFGMVKILRLKL